MFQAKLLYGFGCSTRTFCFETFDVLDIPIVNNVATWLAQQQNGETGAFVEAGIWFDRKMVDPVSLLPWTWLMFYI